MKKAYNPFRMWGSWVGLCIATAFLFFGVDCKDKCIIWGIPAFISIFLIPIGFLIGWGIHYAIRKSKNKKKMAGLRSKIRKKRR